MNWYNLIFFHVFKKYYKNGKYKNDIPWLTASCILGTASSLLIISLIVLFNLLSSNRNIELNNNHLLFGCLFVVFNTLWFKYKSRYLTIYELFKKSKFNSKTFEMLAWVYLALSFLSIPIVSIIKIYQ